MAGVTGEQDVAPAWAGRSAATCGEGNIRVSDAERDVVLTELRRGFAEGRLSHETFVVRVEAALRAQRQGELDDQLADLPAPRRTLTALARSLRAQRAQAGEQARAALARSRRCASGRSLR